MIETSILVQDTPTPDECFELVFKMNLVSNVATQLDNIKYY